MNTLERFGLNRANLNRASFKALGVPLVVLLLSPFLGGFFARSIEGWSFVTCVVWSPLMVCGIWGGGKAWDDWKRPTYPKWLAALALGLNALAPFVVVYAILYL